MKTKTKYLYLSIALVISASVLIYSWSNKKIVTNHNAPSEIDTTVEVSEQNMPQLGLFINEEWCHDVWPIDSEQFKTQSYRSEHQQDDNLWLFWHFTSAFTQGELGCGTNSLSTALYGQKNMINRFLVELWRIEKKQWENTRYDYVREAAKVLQAEARGKNMNQWQWLDCYWGDPDWMLCRKLTMVDWLEAFLPEAVNIVKWWTNTWYWPNDIYNHEWKALNEVLIQRSKDDPRSNGLEFIDNTINLSIPLNSPERWISRRKQKSFREFVMKKINAYDAEFYLARVAWTQDDRINNAASNPVLENWKTLYVNYKEWLLSDKKLTSYTSKLQKMQLDKMQWGVWALPWLSEPIEEMPDTSLPVEEESDVILLPANPEPENDENNIVTLPEYPNTDAWNNEIPPYNAPRAWEEPISLPTEWANNPANNPITITPTKPVNEEKQQNEEKNEEANKIISPEQFTRPVLPTEKVVEEEEKTQPISTQPTNQLIELKTPTIIQLPTANSVILPTYIKYWEDYYTQPTQQKTQKTEIIQSMPTTRSLRF